MVSFWLIMNGQATQKRGIGSAGANLKSADPTPDKLTNFSYRYQTLTGRAPPFQCVYQDLHKPA